MPFFPPSTCAIRETALLDVFVSIIPPPPPPPGAYCPKSLADLLSPPLPP